jgi:hypothetical protein
VFASAREYFSQHGCRFLNLGAGAGLGPSADGLSRFKQGWSTSTRTAYLCGRVLDRDAYDRLVRDSHRGGSDYFPAYRAGEFGG